MNNRFTYGQHSAVDFDYALNEKGWVILENALSDGMVDRINGDLQQAYAYRRSVQIKNGIAGGMEGTLHHLLERDNFGLPFLAERVCDTEIQRFLNGKYVLNGLNAVINEKQESAYVGKMHRDVRTFMGEKKLLVQLIVSLDDFTKENGATYFLSGSHKQDVRPEEGFFYANAERAIMPRGSVVLFDSDLWHAAGENATDKPRRALTVGYTPPYIKPQFDYTRYLGYRFISQQEEHLQQVTGYKARTPQSLEEYYQPPHLRMYQRDQG